MKRFSRLKIAYPISWYEPDSRACREQTSNTVAALANLGHDVTLIAPVPPGQPDLTWEVIANRFGLRAQVKVLNLQSRFAGDSLLNGIRWLHQVKSAVNLSDFDVVYSRLPAILAMGPLLGVPFAFDHYRPWPDVYPIARRFIRWSGNSARCLGLILHSGFAAEAYERAGIDKTRLIVAHNGSAPAVAASTMSRHEARAALGFGQADRIALYAGRVNKQKGLEDVLEMARMRPDVLFVLVGSEGHGALEQEAESIANVRIVGWQTSGGLATYLAAADVLVIPPSSRPLREFGNCILPLKTFSYLAAGRPILAPSLPDTADLLIDGQTALTVEPDNPMIAAQALDRLFTDPALSAYLADNALNLAKECNWDSRAARICDFLYARLGQIGAPVEKKPELAIVPEPLEATAPMRSS